MSKATHATEFYVVGGPVQPDRSCYVERAADAALLSAVRARHLCFVLGARGIGKSSLMHRVARRLRESGELVAIVDLVQIGVLAERGSGRGWGAATAERVAREIALDADVGPWWRAAKSHESERLAEFFWRVVLANTTAPITVFFDGLGTTVAEPPFLRELLATIQRCYARRSAEPDFRRLTFVLLGSVPRRALADGEPGSPLAAADVVEPDDFSATESYTLASGFGDEPAIAQALMDRVTVWTGGHPYLTQKIARGVVRKGGKLEDVERVVHEQLLAPGAAESDPLLTHVRGWLTTKAPGARRAAKLLRKLARGGRVTAPTDPVVHERLQLSGVVTIDAQRRLAFRNRVFRELVGQWVKGAGLAWRLAAAALVLVLLAAAGAYWYVRYLPTADIATLESPTAQLAAVDSAYQRLHALPGFAERAERLFATALVQRSAAAQSVADASAIDARLRSLPSQDETADGLLAAFWLRRATEAAHVEQRDVALLLAQRAADLPAAPAAARGTLAELIDADYPHLERTLRLPTAPVTWRAEPGQSTVVALDAERQLQRASFREVVADAAGSAPPRLTALQHVAVTRDVAVEGDGAAGVFELTVELQHAATEELLLTLTAPSGKEASIGVPHRDGGDAETFSFDAARGAPLAALADESRRGVWRLTLVDRRAGNAGTLAGWALRFGDDSWRDEPAEPVAIPDPLRTDSVTVATAGDWALVQPQTEGAIGTVALWNLARGKLERDFALPNAPKYVAVDQAGSRLIAATEKLATVWNASEGTLVARPATDTEFVLPPVFSTDGGYFAIAERVEDGSPLYSVLRASDGSLVGSFEGVPEARHWWLGPGARYVAVQTSQRAIRVLGARRGELLQTLRSAREVARVLPLPDGAALVTVDEAGDISAWSLATGDPPQPRRLGTTAAAASVSVAAGAARLAYATPDAAIVVVDVATGAEIIRLRGAGGAPAATQMADDGLTLVTSSGAQLRLWNLPPGRAAPRAAGATAVTALTVDRATGRAAFGLADGRFVLGTEPPARAAEALEYLGHRGPVTALTVNVERGLAVTGGADGMLRTWDLASGMPTAVGTEPAAGPVTVVALAADARVLASAAGAAVRVVSAADGATLALRSAEAAVTALAFAPDGAALAIGDAAGTLTIVPLAGTSRAATLKGTAPVTALAFARGGAQLAVGDAAGAVRWVRAADAVAIGTPRVLPQPIRWLDFSTDDATLLLATADWLHALRADAGLGPLASRFAPAPVATMALAAGEGARVRWAEARADARVAVMPFDLAAPPMAAPGGGSRDWPAALGQRLDDAGQPVPFDP